MKLQLLHAFIRAAPVIKSLSLLWRNWDDQKEKNEGANNSGDNIRSLEEI